MSSFRGRKVSLTAVQANILRDFLDGHQLRQDVLSRVNSASEEVKGENAKEGEKLGGRKRTSRSSPELFSAGWLHKVLRNPGEPIELAKLGTLLRVLQELVEEIRLGKIDALRDGLPIPESARAMLPQVERVITELFLLYESAEGRSLPRFSAPGRPMAVGNADYIERSSVEDVIAGLTTSEVVDDLNTLIMSGPRTGKTSAALRFVNAAEQKLGYSGLVFSPLSPLDSHGNHAEQFGEILDSLGNEMGDRWAFKTKLVLETKALSSSFTTWVEANLKSLVGNPTKRLLVIEGLDQYSAKMGYELCEAVYSLCLRLNAVNLSASLVVCLSGSPVPPDKDGYTWVKSEMLSHLGNRIRPRWLTYKQVLSLAERLGLSADKAETSWHWFQGQPYLTHALLREKDEVIWEEFRGEIFDLDEAYQWVPLRGYWSLLLKTLGEPNETSRYWKYAGANNIPTQLYELLGKVIR